MVIICPECTTKFRVNPDRIPAAGAKVRCARCKHVFKALKPVEEPTVETQAFEVPPSAAPEQQEQAPIEQPQEENFSFGDAADSTVTEESEAEESAAEEEFSYDQFRAVEEEKVTEEETFTFSNDQSSEAEGLPSVAAADQPETALGELADTIEEKAEDISEAPEQTAEEVLVGMSTASDDEISNAFTPAEEADAAEEVLVPPVEEKSSAMASVMRVILLLVLGILILGGVLIYMNGPEQFQQTLQQLLGQQKDRPVQTGQISLDKLQGSFINNQESGELFVIRGEAVNKFSEPRASIQVKGVIFDANGKPLLQKTIFVGNPISDQELRSLPYSKIEELMGNQFGQALSNMNVNTDQAIPFAIVFRDLPKSLSEFSVNVTSSQPAAK